MIGSLLQRFKSTSPDLLTSQLFNDRTFYRAFSSDLHTCMNEAFIECPFITSRRIEILLPTLRKLVKRGVRVTVNTRHPQEHEDYLRAEAYKNIPLLQNVGIQVLYTGGHHRKLAIFDKRILWEGSLSILSQNDSCEVMRRIESEELAKQMLRFVKLGRF